MYVYIYVCMCIYMYVYMYYILLSDEARLLRNLLNGYIYNDNENKNQVDGSQFKVLFNDARLSITLMNI